MIGIFDSGSGGLTVLKAIREELPSADIVYFGDIQNAPYGSKSRAELSQLTVAAIRFLIERGAGSIVSACNSVSASLAVSLLDTIALPQGHLIEMVGPTVSYFKHASSRIALAATPATIESGLYQTGFTMLGKNIDTIAIPDLAAAIEFGKSEEEIERIIRDALAGKEGSFDVLILACTHYPLVLPIFERVLGKDVLIFDPAIAVAERAKKQLWPQEAGNGTTHFFISKDSAPFRRFVREILPSDAGSIEVVQ